MDTTAFLDNFSTIADAPGGIDRLRELILDLAVRGELVSQDPADEPAASIVAEYEDNRRVASSKLTEPVGATDLPWSVPASWTWVRLKQVTDFSPGKTPPTKDAQYWADGGGTAWATIADMPKSGVLLNTARRVTPAATERIFKAEPSKAGTLLMSFKLTIGKVCWLGIDAYFNEAIICVSPPSKTLAEYLFRTLPLLAGGGSSKNAVKGKTLNKTSLTNLLIPLPPLAEQTRIVDKVDELMALCDDLEARQQTRYQVTTRLRASALDALTTAITGDDLAVAWQRVHDSWETVAGNTESIDDLRQAILLLGIQGRIVPQGPSAEPVAIAWDAKKLRLTDRKLWSPGWVDGDTPNGWSQVPLARVGRWGSGGTPTRSRSDYYGGSIPWLVIGDLNDSVVTEATTRITALGLRESSAKLVPPGAVLVAMYGSIGKAGIAGIECATNQAIAHCIPDSDVVTTEYLFRLLVALRPTLFDLGKGAAQQNISQTILRHLVVEIPPIAEQERITSRIRELMALSDQLEIQLHSRAELGSELARSIAAVTLSAGSSSSPLAVVSNARANRADNG